MERMARVQPKSVALRPVRAEGFTLIEVIVVVAIVAILASIAIPAYSQFLARGYRSEARATLVAAAQWMERWRTERGTYQDGGNPPALPAGLDRSPPTGAQRYNVTVVTPAANLYTLSAAPIGTFAGDACGTLTLTNTGLRGRTGAESIETCWGR
jgi:type IV pilus assembly protein PilE